MWHRDPTCPNQTALTPIVDGGASRPAVSAQWIMKTRRRNQSERENVIWIKT